MTVNASIPRRILQLVCQVVLLFSASYAVAADVAVPAKMPAPGRGIIPAVSDHYKAQPVFYDFDNLPAEHVTKTIARRFVMGAQGMMMRWDLKTGTKLPLHFHPNEQITRVESGLLEVYSQGNKYVMKAGQVMVFPANVPHEFMAVKDTVLIEMHTPPRQDFVSGVDLSASTLKSR